MSVDDLNTFFIWQRASGTSRPIGHFLSDVSGVKFSDIILDSLNKTYNDLDGNTDGLNFSSYVFDANTDSRTRGCGKVSSNDLVMAYILYKCYGSSTCPTANVIYNLEDAQAMLSSGAVSMSITTSFEDDEQLANLGGVNLGEVDAMFRSMLASAPLRYFQANGTQIPGLFETNYVCPPSDPPAQGSWKFMENDILEVRMTFAFQQPVAHESIDAVGTQSSNTVIKAGDTFSIRLQILATDSNSGAAAKAASSAAAIAAAAAASATAQQQAAANAMLAAAAAQQAVNSAAAQQQADAAQLQLIMTNHAEQQINVNNVAYVYGAAEASLTAAIVSGQAQSITQQTRANALAAAAALTKNQAILANLSTQLITTKMNYDAAVSTLSGSQTVAAAALLTSANAAGVTAAAALAAAQAAAAVTASTISDNECSFSTLQIQMLLSNAINPTLLLSNQIAFTNASNTSLSIWRSALLHQAKEQEAKSKLTTAKQVMDMAIVLGEMANIQIMMANVNAYTALEEKAKANLLSTNMALISAGATEYTAYTTLLSNSNTAANLSNLLALSSYNAASRSLSTTVLNVSSAVSSDSVIQAALATAQANLNSSITNGGLASQNTLLTSSFMAYTALATSSSAAITRVTAASNLAQLLVNSMNSNLIVTASNLSSIVSNNTALLSTFSTSMTAMMNYEQSVLANPSTLQLAQTINSAHITYNTMLEKKQLASNALTVAQRILDTALANQAPPQQIALLQGNVAEAQAKLASAEAALLTSTRLYDSATVSAREDPNSAEILTLAASTMTGSIATALHSQLATNLYSAVSTQNSLTTVLNDTSLTYTLAQAALANAITAGKTISEIQLLNAAVDSAKAAYSRAAIAASAATVAVSTAQAGVNADPNVMSILDSAALLSYSTTQGALASGLVQQVTTLYEGSVLAAQAALSARLNYSTSVAALVSAVAGGATLSGIQGLQSAVNSTSVVYATATRASIQAGAALVRGERVAIVNPLAKTILDTTSVNLAAASISESVQTYGAALVSAEAVTASTLVAMGSAQAAYNLATTMLDTEIASGQSLEKIQRAQSTLQTASSSLAARTVAYNNSLSTLTQSKTFFSTSTAAYTSTLSQANVSPLSDSIAVVNAQVAGLVMALSTQTAVLQSQEVVHLASIAYDRQVSLVSSIAGLSTISSITHAAQSTLTGVSGLSSVSSISSLISTVQSDSLQLALATGSVANATSAASIAQAAASSSALSPYIYTALANYASSASSIQPSPSAPTGMSSSAVTESGFTVRWQGFTAASSYTFVLNGQEVTPTSQTSLSATFSGLTSSTDYTLVITAVNSKGTAPSALFTVSTLSPPPSQPVINVTNITTTTAQINWTGGVGATSYSYSLNGNPTVPIVDSGLISKFIVISGLSGETTYTVVVTATNANGSTASGGFSLRTTGPPSALSVTTSAVSKIGFSMSWTGGTGATSFTFVLNGSAFTPSVSGNSAVFTGLSANTSYTVVATATNGAGSKSATATVKTSMPVFKGYWSPSISYEPTDLVIKGTNDTYDARVYSCLVAGVGNNPQTGNSWSTGSTYLGVWATVWNSGGYPQGVSVLSPLDNKLYVCSTATAGGAQDPSLDTSHWQVIGLAGGAPSPFVVTSVSVEQGGFSMGWTGGAGATSYVFMLNGALVVPSTDNSLTSKSVIFTGLTPGTQYDVAAFAVNSSGSYCPMSFAVTMLPSVPVLTATFVSDTNFIVSWTSVGALSYSYSITDASGRTYTPSTDNGVSAKNIVVTGLSAVSSYTVTVTAVNLAGSAVSAPLTLTTLAGPPPPTQPVVSTVVTPTTITATWTGGIGATSYSYTLNGTPVTPSIDNGVSGNTATFTGLAATTSYTLVVKPINSSGSVSASSAAATVAKPAVLYNGPITNVSFNNLTNTTASVAWTGGGPSTVYSYTIGFGAQGTFDGSTNTGLLTRLNSKSSYPLRLTGITPVITRMMIATYGAPNVIQFSYDGVSWETVTSGSSLIPPSYSGNVVVNNGSQWLVGTNSSNSILYSQTGFDWQVSTSGSALFTAGCSCFAWNGVIWVAGGKGANRMAYSYDGINWTASASGNGIFTQNCSTVAWNGSIWVAGGKTNSLAYSYDGMTWTASPSGNSIFVGGNIVSAVAWSASSSMWVAAGTVMAHSSDGRTWTAAANNILSPAFCLATNGSIWVAGGQNSYTYQLIYSTDGINWTSSSSGNSLLSSRCASVVWNGSKWFACGIKYGGGGAIIESSDGITWTNETPFNAECLATGNGYLSSSGTANVATITVDNDPHSFVASSITDNSFVVRWSVTWPSGYPTLTYTYKLNDVAVTPSSITNNSITFTGLTPSTLYKVSVTSTYSNAGTNEATSSLLVKTIPVGAMPNNLDAINITIDGLTLIWNGGNTATSYAYFFNGIQKTPITDNGVSSKNAIFTGLAPSLDYTIYIVATAPSGTYTSSSFNVRTLDTT